MTRLYQPIALAPHQTVQLDSRGSHHLATVLRAKPGDAVTLFNGTGGEFNARIVSVDKKTVTVMTDTHLARETESPLQLSIALGISRGEKMDFTLQKSVETGRDAIHSADHGILQHASHARTMRKKMASLATDYSACLRAIRTQHDTDSPDAAILRPLA